MSWTNYINLVLPDCSESPLVSSDARQNRQMMGIKGQIPALCGEFWIFPIETILLAEFFNPFCRLSCCHIQTGIFADVNPWLWIMQVIWINLVYNNLEKQEGDFSSDYFSGNLGAIFWMILAISGQFGAKLWGQFGVILESNLWGQVLHNWQKIEHETVSGHHSLIDLNLLTFYIAHQNFLDKI